MNGTSTLVCTFNFLPRNAQINIHTYSTRPKICTHIGYYWNWTSSSTDRKDIPVQHRREHRYTCSNYTSYTRDYVSNTQTHQQHTTICPKRSKGSKYRNNKNTRNDGDGSHCNCYPGISLVYCVKICKLHVLYVSWLLCTGWFTCLSVDGLSLINPFSFLKKNQDNLSGFYSPFYKQNNCAVSCFTLYMYICTFRLLLFLCQSEYNIQITFELYNMAIRELSVLLKFNFANIIMIKYCLRTTVDLKGMTSCNII